MVSMDMTLINSKISFVDQIPQLLRDKVKSDLIIHEIYFLFQRPIHQNIVILILLNLNYSLDHIYGNIQIYYLIQSNQFRYLNNNHQQIVLVFVLHIILN